MLKVAQLLSQTNAACSHKQLSTDSSTIRASLASSKLSEQDTLPTINSKWYQG